MRPFTSVDFTRRCRSPVAGISLPTSIAALLQRCAGVAIAFALIVAVAGTASAQGGAPLSTEDTNTTPKGAWEVNLIGSLSRTSSVTLIAAPDLDVNYGLGERVQVKAELPWVTVREDEAASKSGIGRATAGVKWRLAGEGGADRTFAIFPQYSWTVRNSSSRRGIVPDGQLWFVPVIASMRVRSVPVAADLGRIWGAAATGWAAGIVAGGPCREPLECAAEIRQFRVQHRQATLLNAGLRWKIDDSVSLLAAVGSEFGTSDDRRRLLSYFAVQLRR
jgi:hypothetical protein